MTDDLIGKQIGGYEILTLIGQGGMATVFRARQISMKRDVAIKVLPAQFLNDNTYLKRFEREVKIVAQLEHRNIVPVYDYGETDGQPYIVMRYLTGGSVDEMLNRGPMELDTISRICTQIAPALDYAHTKEVLHRDLKPSNILLDDDGGAFITDFGIALIRGEQGPGITTQGVVGTPSYMSPEQAQALDLDGRSDVYSLGVMLFEMSTGRRPFEAETPYSIAVMQVTQQPPDPRTLNSTIPPSVEQVILKALKKDRNQRYATAAALAEALAYAIDHPGVPPDTQPGFKLTARPTVPRPAPSPPPPMQQVAAPPRHNTPTPRSTNISYPAAGSAPGGWVRKVPRRKGGNPWLSVIIGGLIGCGLLTMLVVGGAFIISNFVNRNTIESVPTVEGGAQAIPTLDPTSEAARQTLVARNSAQSAVTPFVPTNTPPPDTPGNATTTPSGAVGTLGVGEVPTATLSAALRGVSGSIVYFDERQGSFEIVTLNLANRVETQLTMDPITNSYPMASPDGKRVAFQSDRDGDFEIYTVNLVGGELVKVTRNDVFDRLPAWSPDGQWIYFSSDVRNDRSFDIYRVRPDGTDLEPVFSNGNYNSHVRISPDGHYAVFTTGQPNDASTWEIGRLDLQNGDFAVLTSNDYRDSSPVFSPDGQTILYVTSGQGNAALATMNLSGGDQKVLYDGPGFEWSANFSPDGRYIIFNSDATGEDQLYLMTADGQNAQQLTTTGGAYASWIPGR